MGLEGEWPTQPYYALETAMILADFILILRVVGRNGIRPHVAVASLIR